MSAPTAQDHINSFETCGHANHFFKHPLCNNQPLIAKVATVAFHILTIGIPLAVYHVISIAASLIRPKVDTPANLQKVGIDSVRNVPLSEKGKEAMAFARSELENHPELKEFQFCGSWLSRETTHQPCNKEISKLTSLYADTCYKKFEKTLKDNKIDPWSKPEVLNAADALLNP